MSKEKQKIVRIGVSIETSEYALSQGVDNCVSVAFYQASQKGKGVEAIFSTVNKKGFPDYQQYLDIAGYGAAKKFVNEKNQGNFYTYRIEKEKSPEFDEIAVVFHRVSFLLPNEQAYIQGFVNDVASKIGKKIKEGSKVEFEHYDGRILMAHTQDAELTAQIVNNIKMPEVGKTR